MSMRYAHTLIAEPKDVVPTGMKVQAFAAAVVAMGVMGGSAEVKLRWPSGKTRQVRNPFTKKTYTIAIFEHRKLDRVDDVAEATSESGAG